VNFHPRKIQVRRCEMKPVTFRIKKAEPGFGYMNRILRINLSSMEVRSQDSREYFPDFIGGRGVAVKIAWDEYPTPVDPFDPANPLMIFPFWAPGVGQLPRPTPLSIAMTALARSMPRGRFTVRCSATIAWNRPVPRPALCGHLPRRAKEP